MGGKCYERGNSRCDGDKSVMRGEIEDVMLEKRYEGKFKVRGGKCSERGNSRCDGDKGVMRGEIQGVMLLKTL